MRSEDSRGGAARLLSALGLVALLMLIPITGQAQDVVASDSVPEGLSASDWSSIQQAYVKASNTGVGDNFGGSVAVSGDTVVVGAAVERSSATGVNGKQSDNSSQFAGAVYVFVRSGTRWRQQAYLKASNAGWGDFFGISVAVSGDTVVVGASSEASSATGVNGNQSDNSIFYSGAAYVFVRSGTSWSQQAYLKASNTGRGDNFGASVAVSGDTVVVGARYEGSSATGVDGNQNDNNADNAGAAYVFERSGTSWSQQAYLKASNTDANDQFFSVAVSGDTVVVGAFHEASGATGVDADQNDQNDNSASNTGAAYVFGRSGTRWSQQAYLKASNAETNDQFGWRVGVSGDTVVVGANQEDSNATGVNGNQNDETLRGSGAAYVFVRSETSWSQQAYLKASNTGWNDSFGKSVAVSGDMVVVGASLEDSNATGVNGDQNNSSATWSGAAYVFLRSGTSWNQQAYLKASNTDRNDHYGNAVAVSGGTVVVGAFSEDSKARGVNGNQGNNNREASGAAYVYLTESVLPPIVVCDIDENGDVDRDDIAAIFAALGSLASGPDDPMDVDDDGIITVGDGRICTLQCSNTNCSPTSPTSPSGGSAGAGSTGGTGGTGGGTSAPSSDDTGGTVSSSGTSPTPVPMSREVAWVLASVLALGGAQLLRRKK